MLTYVLMRPQIAILCVFNPIFSLLLLFTSLLFTTFGILFAIFCLYFWSEEHQKDCQQYCPVQTTSCRSLEAVFILFSSHGVPLVHIAHSLLWIVHFLHQLYYFKMFAYPCLHLIECGIVISSMFYSGNKDWILKQNENAKTVCTC